MSDLIDRKELGAAIDNWLAIDRYYHPYSKQKTIPVSELVDIIKLLPSAQPEIIRCRDCKNWDKTWTNDWSPEYHYCPMIDGVRKGDFYCAHAERRTDERSDQQTGGD